MSQILWYFKRLKKGFALSHVQSFGGFYKLELEYGLIELKTRESTDQICDLKQSLNLFTNFT